MIEELAKEVVEDDRRKSLRYAIGKGIAKYDLPMFESVCSGYLSHKDVATQGTGLDIFAKNNEFIGNKAESSNYEASGGAFSSEINKNGTIDTITFIVDDITTINLSGITQNDSDFTGREYSITFENTNFEVFKNADEYELFGEQI